MQVLSQCKSDPNPNSDPNVNLPNPVLDPNLNSFSDSLFEAVFSVCCFIRYDNLSNPTFQPQA